MNGLTKCGLYTQWNYSFLKKKEIRTHAIAWTDHDIPPSEISQSPKDKTCMSPLSEVSGVVSIPGTWCSPGAAWRREWGRSVRWGQSFSSARRNVFWRLVGCTTGVKILNVTELCAQKWEVDMVNFRLCVCVFLTTIINQNKVKLGGGLLVG